MRSRTSSSGAHRRTSFEDGRRACRRGSSPRRRRHDAEHRGQRLRGGSPAAGWSCPRTPSRPSRPAASGRRGRGTRSRRGRPSRSRTGSCPAPRSGRRCWAAGVARTAATPPKPCTSQRRDVGHRALLQRRAAQDARDVRRVRDRERQRRPTAGPARTPPPRGRRAGCRGRRTARRDHGRARVELAAEPGSRQREARADRRPTTSATNAGAEDRRAGALHQPAQHVAALRRRSPSRWPPYGPTLAKERSTGFGSNGRRIGPKIASEQGEHDDAEADPAAHPADLARTGRRRVTEWRRPRPPAHRGPGLRGDAHCARLPIATRGSRSA